MTKFEVKTGARAEFINITNRVQDAVTASGVQDGFCMIHVPHTTAGVTINENADPDVVRDMLKVLAEMVPLAGAYQHIEGNSAAHVKSTLVGCTCMAPVEGGRLALGTWQGVFFCEFDGPRARSVWVMCQ